MRGISYGFSFTGGGKAQVEAYIDGGDAVWNKWLFDALHAQHEAIEAQLGEPLEWERLDNRRASRIAAKRPGSIEDPSETLEEIRGWAIDRLMRFKNIVGPRAAAIVSTGGPASSITAFADTL